MSRMSLIGEILRSQAANESFPGDVTVSRKGLLGACGRLKGVPKVSRDSFLHFLRDRLASVGVFCSTECLKNG